jgi:hypothetical protein
VTRESAVKVAARRRTEGELRAVLEIKTTARASLASDAPNAMRSHTHLHIYIFKRQRTENGVWDNLFAVGCRGKALRL